MKKNKQTPEIEIIHASDVYAGMEYPYLPPEWDWEIHNIPFSLIDQASPNPTVRLVRDDKIIDIHVPNMDTSEFLAHWGLRTSLRKGGYVLSKRFSRLIHPYRWWAFVKPDEIKIVHREDWDAALWDGCGRVSKKFLAKRLLPRLVHLPDDKRRKYQRELLHTGRFEITIVHEGGEEKGDVVVFDELPDGADFMFPAGSAKSEFAGEGTVFVGLAAARHAKDGMRFDAQSLINLHPFVSPKHLLEWAEWESGLFMETLKAGEVSPIYTRLAQDEESLAKLVDWHVAEYLASGGKIDWFAGIMREVGRQHINRLEHQTTGKLRFPAPGGRYYIMPAVIGDKDVPPGHVELDKHNATCWVNDSDWLDFIVDVLGGCDGDDGVWVLPFTDWDGSRQILVWRSPNQPGEYVILKPTANCHQIKWKIPGGRTVSYIPLDSRLLPPRVDTVDYEYLKLQELNSNSSDAPYAVSAMDTTIELAMGNIGTLGSFCNALMVIKAMYGKLPLKLPATLEIIIDGSVKKFIDLTPVKQWIENAAQRIVLALHAVPAALLDRFTPLVPKQLRGQIIVSQNHWLDQLLAGIEVHKANYLEELEELASRCSPPSTLFQAVTQAWKPLGREFRRQYASVLREGGHLGQARMVCESFLEEVPEPARPTVLLASAAYCYTLGKKDTDARFSDGCVWQLGERLATGGREPGIAQGFIRALREQGLIGQPVWTGEGAKLEYRRQENIPVPVMFNGVWFNFAKVMNPHLKGLPMGQIPKDVRARLKGLIAKLVETKFKGMTLLIQKQGRRLVAMTLAGNLFGYVEKGHEERFGRRQAWTIEWAVEVDGNVSALLQPCGVLGVQQALPISFAESKEVNVPISSTVFSYRVSNNKRVLCETPGRLRRKSQKRPRPRQLTLF